MAINRGFRFHSHWMFWVGPGKGWLLWIFQFHTNLWTFLASGVGAAAAALCHEYIFRLLLGVYLRRWWPWWPWFLMMVIRLERYIANIAFLDRWLVTIGNNCIWWSMNLKSIAKTRRHKQQKPKNTWRNQPKFVINHNIEKHCQRWWNPNNCIWWSMNLLYIAKTSVLIVLN